MRYNRIMARILFLVFILSSSEYIWAMDPPSPCVWIKTDFGMCYLQQKTFPDEAIINVNFNAGSSCQVAFLRLLSLLPVLNIMSEDGTVPMRIKLDMSEEAFSLHVCAYYAKHEMGIDISNAELGDRKSGNDRLFILNSLYVHAAEAGQELISQGVLLNPSAFKNYLNLLKDSIEAYSIAVRRQGDLLQIENAIKAYHQTIFEHFLQLGIGEPICHNQVSFIKSCGFTALFLLPLSYEQFKELRSYKNTGAVVASFLVNYYLFRIKYPKAPQFKYTIGWNNSDFTLSRNLEIKKKFFRCTKLTDAESHQVAYEVNAGIAMITTILKERGLPFKLVEDCNNSEHQLCILVNPPL